jgi:hypothetical protein
MRNRVRGGSYLGWPTELRIAEARNETAVAGDETAVTGGRRARLSR